MPKIRCKCDNIIRLSDIPSPNQWLIISDVEFDKFSGMVNSEDVFNKMKIAVKCNQCGRLHIYWDGFDKDAIIYLEDK